MEFKTEYKYRLRFLHSFAIGSASIAFSIIFFWLTYLSLTEEVLSRIESNAESNLIYQILFSLIGLIFLLAGLRILWLLLMRKYWLIISEKGIWVMPSLMSKMVFVSWSQIENISSTPAPTVVPLNLDFFSVRMLDTVSISLKQPKEFTTKLNLLVSLDSRVKGFFNLGHITISARYVDIQTDDAFIIMRDRWQNSELENGHKIQE